MTEFENRQAKAGTGRRPHRSGRPWVCRAGQNQKPVGPQGLGRPDERTEIAGILHAIDDQQPHLREIFPPAAGNLCHDEDSLWRDGVRELGQLGAGDGRAGYAIPAQPFYENINRRIRECTLREQAMQHLQVRIEEVSDDPSSLRDQETSFRPLLAPKQSTQPLSFIQARHGTPPPGTLVERRIDKTWSETMRDTVRETDLPPVALTIAGSDSGGGAGIQADLKTFHSFHVFGTTAVTAVTVQNTVGVTGVHPIPPDIVEAQIRAVADDLRPAACKSGMLADATIIEAVARGLAAVSIPAYVLDPVMVATSGDPLLENSAVDALRSELFPLATVVTPNLHEAEILTGTRIESEADMRRAAERILSDGAAAVLLKGGHLDGDEVIDLLLTESGERSWRASRLPVGNAHGTGCTLSAAIAAGLATGRSLEQAVESGIDFTRRALRTAPGLGSGATPLNHWTRP
jgi:hydroxymethylpyrimidine/phosphomethylpyrimidine kinase